MKNQYNIYDERGNNEQFKNKIIYKKRISNENIMNNYNRYKMVNSSINIAFYNIKINPFKSLNIKEQTIINKDSVKSGYSHIKKRKNIILENTKSMNAFIISFIIKSVITINIFSQIFGRFGFSDSKITLIIKGIGESTILGNKTYYNSFKGINYLKEVKINRCKQDLIEYRYNFNKTDNSVELIWDDNITNCDFMFYGCTNITEINLSNFNTSLVTSMDEMFNGCSSLISLELSNFDTSKVERMNYMFKNCSLLNSLDLSSFITSQVVYMDEIFYNCINLEYITIFYIVNVSSF